MWSLKEKILVCLLILRCVDLRGFSLKPLSREGGWEAVVLQFQRVLDKLDYPDAPVNFRPAYGTEMTLVTFLDDLWWKQDWPSASIPNLLDLLVVFNTINHDILLGWLQELGMGASVLCWFTSLLHGALQYSMLSLLLLTSSWSHWIRSSFTMRWGIISVLMTPRYIYLCPKQNNWCCGCPFVVLWGCGGLDGEYASAEAWWDRVAVDGRHLCVWKFIIFGSGKVCTAPDGPGA